MKAKPRKVGPKPAWDEDKAALLIGAKVLIGVTRIHPHGHEQEQMFGLVRPVDAKDGVSVALGGSRLGQTQWLPPVLDAFKPAAPGDYLLHATGEAVRDPDYLVTWTVKVEEKAP